VSVAGFIAIQRVEHGVPHATSCRALGMSQAWFYKWCHGDPSPRHARRVQLAAKIQQLFAKHRSRYGSPRITADLRDQGWVVSVNTVAKIMRELGLRSRPKRRRKQTTRQGKGWWRAPDLIGRDFAADQLNRKWYGDGTELVTDLLKHLLERKVGQHQSAQLRKSSLRVYPGRRHRSSRCRSSECRSRWHADHTTTVERREIGGRAVKDQQ
jgi:hypothetical protein